MTNLEKCNYFEWKCEDKKEGYYKNLLYSLKQKLDAKVDLGVINNLRNKIAELEFFLAKEKCNLPYFNLFFKHKVFIQFTKTKI
uniref:Uncharacterized protein n=1 Tax=Lactuca sativa TaxID=4236 RepID=A0A9R1XKJ8_LACSA|nr:hypothetical protein LSAT_V11C400225950 [Lactuca sativa]